MVSSDAQSRFAENCESAADFSNLPTINFTMENEVFSFEPVNYMSRGAEKRCYLDFYNSTTIVTWLFGQDFIRGRKMVFNMEEMTMGIEVEGSDNNDPTSGGGGLSSGAKAGIAIVVIVVVLGGIGGKSSLG